MRSRGARVAAAALAALLGAAAWAASHPVAAQTAYRRLSLRAAGARRVRAGGLEAYERSTCRRGAPCRCAAFVHGLGDSAVTWDRILLGGSGAAPPPEGWRLLALDLPGTDGSPPPGEPAGYGARAMASAVAGALDSRAGACPGGWSVVGNSLGGWVAVWLALDRPDLARELLLVNAAGLWDPLGVETGRLLSAPDAAVLRALEPRLRHGARGDLPDWILEQAARQIRARPVAEMFRAFRLEDALDGRLAALRVPTRVLWGESDRLFTPGLGRKFHRLIPGSAYLPVPACGHVPQQECPAAVSRALFGAG